METRTKLLLLAGIVLAFTLIFILLVTLFSSSSSATGTGTGTSSSGTKTGTGTGTGTKTITQLATPTNFVFSGWPEFLVLSWDSVPSATSYTVTYSSSEITTSVSTTTSDPRWSMQLPFDTFNPGIVVKFTVTASALATSYSTSSSGLATYTPVSPPVPGSIAFLNVALSASLSGFPNVMLGWSSATDAYYYWLVITSSSTNTTLLSRRVDALGIGGIQLSESDTSSFPTDSAVTFSVYAQNSTGVGPSTSQVYNPGATSVISNFTWSLDSTGSIITFSWAAPTTLSVSLAYNVIGYDANGYVIGELSFPNNVGTLSVSGPVSQFASQLFLPSGNLYFVVLGVDANYAVQAKSPKSAPYPFVNAASISTFTGTLVLSGTTINPSIIRLDTSSLDFAGIVDGGNGTEDLSSAGASFANATNNTITVGVGASNFTMTYSPTNHTISISTVGANGDTDASGTLTRLSS